MIIRLLFLILFFTSTAFAGPEVSGGEFDPATPGDIGGTTPGAGRFGDASNYVDIDSSGVLSLVGTAKRYYSRRPKMNVIHQIAHAVPDEVQQGVYFGYSMPVFNSDNEELYFRDRVPYRWDGASDFTFELYVWLSGGEDVGDYLKFQLSWEHNEHEALMPSTSNDVTAEQAVLTGRNNQYDCYKLSFTIDYDIDGSGNEIMAGSNWGARLRRVDATNPDVTNEIVACDWMLKYQIDKFAGTW